MFAYTGVASGKRQKHEVSNLHYFILVPVSYITLIIFAKFIKTLSTCVCPLKA